MKFKKSSPILKGVLVLTIVTVFGYLGLDVSQNYIEEVVEEQLAESENNPIDTSETTAVAYPVLSVIDGDTLVVDSNGEKQTVRVIGIDTPETEYSPAGAECYGEESTDRARALLQGTYVTLKTDPSQSKIDDYDRLLAYVEMEDGNDSGMVMIDEGYAKEYTYKSTTYANQLLYKAVERKARDSNLGVWGCER